MKVVFLGTNGWYDTQTGNTLCVLVETRNEYIIFDAGNGFYKIDQFIKQEKPINVYISHYHIDHIAGFHMLVKFKFAQGMNIYGPAGLRKCFNDVVKKPYTVPIKRLKMKVRLVELHKNTQVPIDIRFAGLLHSTKCYGYRLAADGKVVTFCTDTGICDNLLELAKNADLLITECSFMSGQENKKWPHLNPETAAKTAVLAKVKKLALVHFDASLYTSLNERKVAEKKAQDIFKSAFAAFDGQDVLV